ncbi:MAG: cupredoxin domain-containing protein [Nitrosotalea sp.]
MVTSLPAFAEGSNISINITGGSEASQSCVSEKSCYYPDVITVSPNTMVTWTNIDSTTHTVTSGEPSENVTDVMFDSDQIAPAATYSYMFMSPGTYDYFCSIHPWMTGQIIVSASTVTTTSSSNSVSTPEFGPAVILVFSISVFTVMFLAKNRLSFKF